jgi:hypothetical protein
MQLTDEELLQRVWAERDPLTTTALETQLAERLQELLDESTQHVEHVEVVEEFDVSADQVRTALQLAIDWPNARELLDVLNDFDYDNGEILRGKLARLQQFDQAMEDLREPLQSLTNLATTE